MYNDKALITGHCHSWLAIAIIGSSSARGDTPTQMFVKRAYDVVGNYFYNTKNKIKHEFTPIITSMTVNKPQVLVDLFQNEIIIMFSWSTSKTERKRHFSTCRHRQTVLVIFVEKTFFVQFLRRIKKISLLVHFEYLHFSAISHLLNYY